MRRRERADAAAHAVTPAIQDDAMRSCDGAKDASMSDCGLSRRKDDHLDIVLDQRMTSATAAAAAGWDRIRFEHCALPELALAQIDLRASLFGKALRAPLLISSMTGGTARAEAINRHLSEAAQALGIAMCVGSQRVSLRSGNSQGLTRALRRLAPDVPLLANLGAAQLCEADGLDLARRAVEALEADALIVHLNPLQEAVQPEGDRDWRGVLAQIARAVRSVGVPIVVKEVGSGLSASVACALVDAGVVAIDVAGAGGTSWAAVEGARASDPADRAVAMAFADWGIPTPLSVQAVREALPAVTLIASGGVRDGVDVAKAIRLGADIAGQAAGVLRAAALSTEAVVAHFEIVIRQLAVVCFCTGSADLAALRQARLLPSAHPPAD
ncbi:type 2 isopentenyl-diphosphate Delta-isomerase [Xanthomonas translucens pv. translucens]|uniref:Isopentenyl-diphosphate delta-isomerase n=2 Tax=Xanthomonas campestris pv. translucens TaxID=343 RepID=A0A120EVY8_XANCT|nr:type 2 isopentenyl-diphosphate Delta-isomerase [Xanthomonas translucens]KWV12034.1 isopentenyl pyrophosphate isomerase [Xanthomonas translucens]QSQ35917.1 type 2 isopentenyl-diphosphate Delta-isomerase [Xanthomonas translucens pv. translucens]QSQ44806.1 type 2 isopentenyl-diphosphate Delta-isomerase [Xanthomonas translucens pv. translucens]